METSTKVTKVLRLSRMLLQRRTCCLKQTKDRCREAAADVVVQVAISVVVTHRRRYNNHPP